MTSFVRLGGARLGRLGAAALLLGAVGCDVPTELPKWNTTWLAPGGDTRVAVSTFLPSGVTIATGGTEFQLDLSSVTFSRSLGEMCSGCSALNGLVVPKPAFTADLESSVSLPSNVLSANISGGRIDVLLNHDLGFDPLRPSASSRGFLVITALVGQTVLAKDSVNGLNTALPANTNVLRTLTLGTSMVSGPITIRVRLTSPAGDPVVVNTNQRLSVNATPAAIRISQAQVRVTSQTITTDSEELPVEDIEDDIADRVKGGALRFQIENPFSASGNVQVRIAAPGVPTIVKAVQIAAVSTIQNPRVVFTQSELQSILGRDGVTLSVTGTVSAPSTGTAVRPTDAIVIRTQLELTVGPKEN